jgi:hypothetical protein
VAGGAGFWTGSADVIAVSLDRKRSGIRHKIMCLIKGSALDGNKWPTVSLSCFSSLKEMILNYVTDDSLDYALLPFFMAP